MSLHWHSLFLFWNCTLIMVLTIHLYLRLVIQRLKTVHGTLSHRWCCRIIIFKVFPRQRKPWSLKYVHWRSWRTSSCLKISSSLLVVSSPADIYGFSSISLRFWRTMFLFLIIRHRTFCLELSVDSGSVVYFQD